MAGIPQISHKMASQNGIDFGNIHTQHRAKHVFKEDS